MPVGATAPGRPPELRYCVWFNVYRNPYGRPYGHYRWKLPHRIYSPGDVPSLKGVPQRLLRVEQA